MCEKSYISAAAPIDTMTLHNQVCQRDASEALSHHKMESAQQSLLGKPLFRNPGREG